MNALAEADIAAFPYDASAEGGSAAVADAIAAGLPVVVSPSAIFDDIRHIASTCRAEPQELANTLIGILISKDLYRKLSNLSQGYAARNSWEGVINTIFGLLI